MRDFVPQKNISCQLHSADVPAFSKFWSGVIVGTGGGDGLTLSFGIALDESAAHGTTSPTLHMFYRIFVQDRSLRNDSKISRQ